MALTNSRFVFLVFFFFRSLALFLFISFAQTNDQHGKIVVRLREQTETKRSNARIKVTGRVGLKPENLCETQSDSEALIIWAISSLRVQFLTQNHEDWQIKVKGRIHPKTDKTVDSFNFSILLTITEISKDI